MGLLLIIGVYVLLIILLVRKERNEDRTIRTDRGSSNIKED